MSKFKLGEIVYLYKSTELWQVTEIIAYLVLPVGMHITSSEQWYKILNIEKGTYSRTNESSLVKISVPYCRIWRDVCLE